MAHRAEPSGITLSGHDAAVVKGMLIRGDRQHDIAAWFGVNGGRIAEIATGVKFEWVEASPREALPPPGPYPAGREALAALTALAAARQAIDLAEHTVKRECGIR